MTAFELITVSWPALGVGIHWRRPKRIAMVGAIVVGQLLFSYAFKEEENAFWYYFGAACCDLITLAIIRYMPVTSATLDVMLLLILSMAFNAIGYLLWYAYIGPQIYDNAMLSLLVVQTARILMVTGNDRRDVEADNWHSLVSRYNIGRNHQISGKVA